MKKSMKKNIYIKNWLVKNLWAIFILVSFVFGIVGYLEYYLTKHNRGLLYNFLNSLYSTIRLYTLNMDVDGVNSISGTLEVARWLAIVATALTIVKAVNSFFRQWIGLLTIRFSKEHTIVFGLNKYSNTLIVDLIEKGNKVTVIEKDENNEYIKELKEKKILIIQSEFIDEKIARKVNIKNCKSIVVFTLNDFKNIETVLSIDKCLKRCNKEIKCIIHILNKSFIEIFEDKNNIKNLDVKFFNIHENNAKVLFETYPLYKTIKNLNKETVSSNVGHLVLIGFGITGENVLLQAAKIAHFGNGQKLKVTVLDNDIQLKEEFFRQRYEYIDKTCDLTFIKSDIFSKDFYKLIPKDITYAAVSLDNDESNSIVAMNILRHIEQSSITVAIKTVGETGFFEWIDGNSENYKNIKVFGKLKECASEDIIINDKLDKFAKAINLTYEKSNGRNEDNWNSLILWIKESNRAQADHQLTKLYLLGLSIAEKKDLDGINETGFYNIIEPKIEFLARLEHERWCAFHYINGWKYDIDDNRKKKHHASLTSWEELSNKNRKYNIDSVKDIYSNIHNAEFEIIKLEEEIDNV